MLLINIIKFIFVFSILLPANNTKTINNYTEQLNKTVQNFTLKDYNGQFYSLYDFKKSKAIVLIFISTECPVSNGYNKRIKDIYNTFSGKNITLIGINSNKQETISEIKQNARQNKFDFIILKDVNNVVANKLGASVTPEVFVLNNNFQIIYHGRIDDSRREDKVKNEDLKNVLNAYLQGKKIANRETKAFGCSIKKVD